MTEPKLSDSGVHRKMLRDHRTSLRDTVIGTGFLVGGFYLVHIRLHRTEPLGWVDAAIFGGLLLVGLAIGYRDRIPLLTGGATRVIRARLSGRHVPPRES